MPGRPSFLPNDVFQRASAARFADKADRDIWHLGFGQQADTDIEDLASLIEIPDPAPKLGQFSEPEASPFSPSPSLAPADPLPIVTTGMPTIAPPPARVPLNEAPEAPVPTPSGTPAGMPTAPGLTSATITSGPRPGQQLQPGESVASVTIAGKNPEGQQAVYRAARTSGRSDEDARILAAVTETEGGWGGAVGDNGQSRGIFQFHERGEMPGFRAWVQQQGIPGDPNQLAYDPAIATRYAATTYLGRALDEGRAKGLSGAQLATYVQQHGQRSVDPGKTGQNYTRLFGDGAPPQVPQARTPVQAEQTPAAQRQAPTSLTDITPAQYGLGDADADSICGPVLAMAFARANGRNPTIAEAKAMAAKNGGWTSAQGMGGPEAMAATLRSMEIPATYKEGPLDIDRIRQETANGNPVGINTRGHYFVVEGVDAEGRLNLGNSAANALKSSGGRRWFKPEEIAGLGMGAPTGAIYRDAQSSPTPSAAVKETGIPPVAPVQPAATETKIKVRDQWGNEFEMSQESLNKRPGGTSDLTIIGPVALNTGAVSSPAASVAAAGGSSPASGGPELWSPDEMPVQGGAYQAATGRSGGAGVMMRAPLGDTPVRDRWADDPQQPFDPDQGPREAGYTVGGVSPGGSGTPDAASTTLPPVAQPAPYPQPSIAPPITAFDPSDPDQGARELAQLTYNDPTAGGTITAPVPPPVAPSYTLQDGRTTPPTPQGTWEPAQTVQPYDPRIADEGQRETGPLPFTPLSPVAEAVTQPTAISPYDAPQPWRPTLTLGSPPQGPSTPPAAPNAALDAPIPYGPPLSEAGPAGPPEEPTTWYGRAGQAALTAIAPALEAYDAANEWLINNPVTGTFNPQAMGRELAGADQISREVKEDQARLELLIRRFRAGDTSVEPEIQSLTANLNARTGGGTAGLLAAGERNPDKGAETAGQIAQAALTFGIAPSAGAGAVRNVVGAAMDPIGQGIGLAADAVAPVVRGARAAGRRVGEALNAGADAPLPSSLGSGFVPSGAADDASNAAPTISPGQSQRAGRLISETGTPLNPDDYVTVYHGTDAATAQRLVNEGITPGGKTQKPPTIIEDEAVAQMLGRKVGDPLEYEPGRGMGQGIYVSATPSDTKVFGDAVVGIRVRVGDLASPPERPRLTPDRALLVNDGYINRPIPADDVTLVSAPSTTPRATVTTPNAGRLPEGEMQLGSGMVPDAIKYPSSAATREGPTGIGPVPSSASSKSRPVSHTTEEWEQVGQEWKDAIARHGEDSPQAASAQRKFDQYQADDDAAYDWDHDWNRIEAEERASRRPPSEWQGPRPHEMPRREYVGSPPVHDELPWRGAESMVRDLSAVGVRLDDIQPIVEVATVSRGPNRVERYALGVDPQDPQHVILLHRPEVDGRPEFDGWDLVGEYEGGGSKFGIEPSHRGRGLGPRFLLAAQEYLKDASEPIGYSAAGFANRNRAHRLAVEQALSRGERVPAEVLADYPDLAQRGGGPRPTGSGLIPSMSDARNAAQGGVVGAASEMTSDEELTPQERMARIGAGAALGVAAGRAGRGAGRRLGSGVVPQSEWNWGAPYKDMPTEQLDQVRRNHMGARDRVRQNEHLRGLPPEENAEYIKRTAKIDEIEGILAQRADEATAARRAEAVAETEKTGALRITRDERKDILRNVKDRYVETNRPKIEKGIDSRGETIYGYEHSPDVFLTSDLSGKPIRHYVTLPDGRIAHPDEITDAMRRGRIVVGDAPKSSGTTAAGQYTQPRLLGSGFVPSGADDLADAGPIPRNRMNMDDIASRAEEVLGVKPDEVKRWQKETLAEPAYGRAVRGSALQQAAIRDEAAAMKAIERLEAAQHTARSVDDIKDLSAAERMELADATLEAAETALAFQGSRAASTAEGRATARALAQRRQQITARQGMESAKRAAQVAQEAQQAAQIVKRASATGRLTAKDETILREVMRKLNEADKHGLAGDGAGGRLAALEQTNPEVAAAVEDVRTGMRSESSRYTPGLGTRAASAIGQALVPGTVGAAVGASLDEEDPRRGAALGFAAGATAGLGARRLARRIPGGDRTLGLLGPMPTPEMPNRSIALGPDSKQYTFAYRVADLDDLVTSNTPSGTVNPVYPSELQPRDRTRAASQVQVDRIVQEFNPTELLHDGGRLDSGPMIVGPDRAVESGNGRTMALRRLAQERPEEYARYVETMRQNLSDYGLDEAALEGKRTPVLVRERLSEVDRPAFAATANGRVSAGMSPVEQARQAATSLSDEVVGNLTIGDGDTIATALRRAENQDVVRAWVAAMPENDVANILDQNGSISGPGYQQLADTLLVRTYGEGAGVRAFVEAADSDVRNVQTAVMASLPDMARAEALIRSGQRDASLSLAGDVAAATEVLARLRRDGTKVGDYVRQVAMGDRELTPFQEQVLQFLDQNQKRPGAIREALREYAAAVENAADPNQLDMFGGAVGSVTKEDAWTSSIAGIRREREARVAGQRAKLQAENAARTPAHEIVPSTGGPEGRLDVEGAPPRPAGLAPATDYPSTGGRPLELTSEGAPAPVSRPGAPEDAPRTGGPEGQLEVAGAPRPIPRPGPVEDIMPGGPRVGAEDELTLASGRTVKEVAAQIDDVLKNMNAPDAVQRLQQLHVALQEVNRHGNKRSSDIKRSLHKNGLLRAGLAEGTEDVNALVTAMSKADPSKPEEMQAILKIISKPRLIDKLTEYQYVNMLSSPMTQLVNVSSNAAQMAARLAFTNPLEHVFTGGQSSGVGAAFEGTARGFREAKSEVGQILRTGVSNKSMERAAELGDYANVRREFLTEQFGRTGALMHMISTRPLQAMDALFGHMAYAGAAEQYAQRTADRLLKAGDPAVKGMSREAARAHVMSNIWDYPDIVEKAGKISDYTLLKSNDSKGTGWGNRAEAGLRNLAALSRADSKDQFHHQALAFLSNQAMPFFNVPLNAAKQGFERSAGAVYNPIRAAAAAGDVRAAKKAGDAAGEYAARERYGELAAKGTIAIGALTTATVLALGDNLTGDGPSDPGDREVWEQTHKRNSWRIPGTETWYSWEGTPMAVPFGMVAGAKKGISESRESSAKKGENINPGDAAATAVMRGGQGAFSGFASQSFVRALGQQYQLMTGDQTGLGTIAAGAAGTASRFMPSSSMVNWLARVTDTMERDAGKPQVASDLRENVGARLATRIPGLRQQVDTKLDMYGEDMPNEQFGLAGAIPYYRGVGARAGDPITRAVEASGVGAPQGANEVSIPKLPGAKVPLKTPQERRIFEQAYGQAYRRNLQLARAEEGDLPPEAITKLKALARDEAVGAVLQAIDTDEIYRRLGAASAAGAR